MTGRGTGRGWKVLAWRGGRSVLFSLLLGQLHPPWWPSPSTCAKECAWERQPGRRAGGAAKLRPPGGSTQVNVEVPGHHAQSQAAPTPSRPPGPQGVLGRWYHVWLPPPHQLGLGLCPQLLPDDQRDRQHLDSLPAHLVLPVAPPGAGGRPGLPVGALPLAAARLPAARLPLPVCVVLRAHLQLHVTPRASHLLLPGLRRAQPLQPGFPELESPALSKILRTAAFTYPFLFDNLPLFYRATATSYSTSVQCWAHTSSWRRCWLIWDLAEPGWPCRNRRWAWRAQWPHWAWQWLGTCSSLLLSQLPYFRLPVRAPCCRVARWRGIQRPNYSEAPALSLPWREAEARCPPPRPHPRAGEEPRPRPDKTGALLSLEPRGVAEERVRRSEGRGEERGWEAGRE
ncbi:membrane progestin receptor delta isoform X4 [Orcinus orca]|uniref:membrane progestin receptor delta isoform X4 n=1 Tax=Orcinus orca TaxID=9733 RepID=UPI0021134ED1|nr:membrane progestin receptor delta isoform X4 [Orcinus orca]